MNSAFFKLSKCGLAAVALVSIAGCAMLGARNSAPQPVKLSADAKVLDVPIEKQDAASLCGLVVVDMLTKYYRQELSSEQHDSLKSIAIANNGIDGDQLVASLNKAGYYAVVYPGALDHTPTGIYSQIDNGRPVIVMLKSTVNGLTHFTIISGYDPKNDYVILTDPVLGQNVMRAKDFSDRWLGTSQFTLLAVPQPQHS
jgi:ABC-type bacteriocin/lantibiotic exporter with double-glycine peptidase domain